jgi:hypothetical protein
MSIYNHPKGIETCVSATKTKTRQVNKITETRQVVVPDKGAYDSVVTMFMLRGIFGRFVASRICIRYQASWAWNEAPQK